VSRGELIGKKFVLCGLLGRAGGKAAPVEMKKRQNVAPNNGEAKKNRQEKF